MEMIRINQRIKYLISFILAVLVAIVCSLNLSAASKEYRVSFKVGSKGTLPNGETSYNQIIEAGGNLTTNPDTIVAMLEVKDGYYFNGWNYTVQQTGITKSANYVAQYKRIVNEAVYRVSYVDNYGNQLATPKTVTSNIGIVVAENAINIDGYAVDQLTKTATVEKEGTEIIFTYYSTAKGNIETVIQNDVVVVAGATSGAVTTTPVSTDTPVTTDNGNSATTSNDSTSNGSTGNEAGGTGGLGTEEVADDETPLTDGEENDKKSIKSYKDLLICGGVIGIIIIAGVIYYIVKRK